MSLISGSQASTSDLVKNTTQLLKNKWVKMLVASAIYLMPFVLLFLPYYIGVVLFVLLYGHFTVGFIKYTRQLINNQNPKLKTIFAHRPNMWLSGLLGVVFALGVALGAILAVVPAVVFLAFFGLIMFAHEEDDTLSFVGAFKKSVAKTEGSKAEMFSYKIVYYVAYLCIGLLSAILMVAVNNVMADAALVGVSLAILLAIVVFIVLVFITAHYQVSNIMFYDSLTTKTKEDKDKQKQEKEDNTSLIPGSDGSFDVMSDEDEDKEKGEEVTVSEEATIVVSDENGDVSQDIVVETVHLAETDKAESKAENKAENKAEVKVEDKAEVKTENKKKPTKKDK